MLLRYLTVNNEGEASVIVKKSEFIAYIKRITSEEEASEFIDMIKKKHWNATHNCYAYIIGENDEMQKASDDGEPSGTAGKPILELLKKMKLKETIVIVTRYFGGVKLGTGGLIRAYGAAAKEGILATGIIERVLCREINVTINYTWYGKLENELNSRGYNINKIEFLDNVTVTILIEYNEVDHFRKMMMNITNGQADVKVGETIYVDRPY